MLYRFWLTGQTCSRLENKDLFFDEIDCLFIPSLVLPVAHNTYTASKSAGLLITILAACGAVYLENTATRQRVWVWLLVTVGFGLVIGLILAPNTTPVLGGIALAGSNTIAAAQMAGVAFLVAFAGAMSLSGYQRLGALLVCGLFGTSLVAAGARGPLISAAFAVCVITATIRTNRRYDRFVTFGAVAAAGLLYLLLAGNAGADRIVAWISGSSSGTDSRTGVWSVAIDHILHHPFSLTGIGWGQFSTLLGPDELLNSGVRQYPHNVILEIWVEAGSLAALTTVIFILASLWQLLHHARSGYGAALLAVALFAVGNAMSSGDVNDNRLMWVSLAIAWVVDDRIGAWVWPKPVAVRGAIRKWRNRRFELVEELAERPHDG